MDAAALTAIDTVLDEAVCWGAELDTQYRVLALTVEPTADAHPDGEVEDRRLQLVLHPCTQIEAQLIHEGTTLERFEVEQLPLVVDRLDGPPLTAPVLGTSHGPLRGGTSIAGRADVLDGRTHEAMVVLQGADRTLRLRATFDTAELRRPDGSTVDVAEGS